MVGRLVWTQYGPHKIPMSLDIYSFISLSNLVFEPWDFQKLSFLGLYSDEYDWYHGAPGFTWTDNFADKHLCITLSVCILCTKVFYLLLSVLTYWVLRMSRRAVVEGFNTICFWCGPVPVILVHDKDDIQVGFYVV